MRRLFPFPLLWGCLFAVWLLLAGSLGLGQILLGVVIATLACWAVAPLEPPRPRIRRLGTILQLVGAVIADVVMSNIAVLGLILSGRPARSAFVTIPLELDDPNGLVILACIVTATPGSAWIQYDSTRRTVTIHVLDTPDEAAWSAGLKRNYEARLVEIYQ